MDNRELSRHFASAGRMYGYDDVSAEFVPFRDFKVRWTRNYRWATFEVSDYLSDAPEDVIRPLADTIFQRIRGDKSDYPKAVGDWLRDPGFARRMQPLYLGRHVGLSKSPVGRYRDLAESYSRLVDAGLVTEDPDLFLGWAPSSRSRVVGHVSVLMKVITMSPSLDTSMIREELMDYCVYSQVAHLSMGFNPGIGSRGKEYDDLLSRFPDRMGMESELRRLCLHVRGCPPCANTPFHRPTMTPASGR